jgi:hypothetical protein
MAVEQHRQRLAADAQPGRGLRNRQLQWPDIKVTDDLTGVRGFFMGIGVSSC